MLNLSVPKHAERVQDCLENYFTDKIVHDYQHNGRKARAWHKQLVDKLPNVLCIHLKRFIYTDRLIKMKDYIKFDEILNFDDRFVSPSLRVGIFNTQMPVIKKPSQQWQPKSLETEI